MALSLSHLSEQNVLRADHPLYPYLLRIKLHPFQEQAVAGVRELFLKGARRVILQLGTGAGKTVCSAEILRRAYEKSIPALFLAHRRRLVDQTCMRLDEHSVPYGVIMARRPLTTALIQIASKDTLLSRCVRRGVMELPRPGLVVVDECHGSMAEQYLALFRMWPQALFLGLTATPGRLDGLGLGDFWAALHCGAGNGELIRNGFLVPCRLKAPHIPDLRGIKTGANKDYVLAQSARAMDTPKLVGNVVEWWLKLARGRPTVVFATKIDHSLHLRDAFRAAGVRAEHMDNKTPDHERDRLTDGLADGTVEVLSNVGIMPEGFDVPQISCVVICRPTRSMVLWLQMVGRGKRVCADKADLLVIDHAGCCLELCHPDDDLEWKLTTGEKPYEPKDKPPPGEPRQVRCPNCFEVFSGTNVCPACGHKIDKPKQPAAKRHRAGQLLDVDSEGLKKMRSPEARQKYWNRCLAICAHGNKPLKVAAAMYKARFGEYPDPSLHNHPGPGHWQESAAVIFPQFLAPHLRRAAGQEGGEVE